MNGVNPLQVMQLAGVVQQLLDLLKETPVAKYSDMADIEEVKVENETMYMVTLRTAFATKKEAENFSTIDSHIEELTNALRKISPKQKAK